VGEAQAITWDQPSEGRANAWLTLGPCAPQGLGFCPVRSHWNSLTRFGRHGDIAVQSGQPFKRPVLLAKAGSLFWPEQPGIEESPLGPLFGDELPDGEWQGYHYRILTAQGASAPGGAYDYRLGDNMTRGFALIAWPAEYADSGVMSFMISHEGQVFEKDLGPDGTKLATSMGRFDPDSSWSEVAAEAEVEALATP